MPTSTTLTLTSFASIAVSPILTRASNSRAADPETLAQHAQAIAPGLPVIVEPSPAAAHAAAWALSPRIVVAGSIFLLGDVLKDVERT